LRIVGNAPDHVPPSTQSVSTPRLPRRIHDPCILVLPVGPRVLDPFNICFGFNIKLSARKWCLSARLCEIAAQCSGISFTISPFSYCPGYLSFIDSADYSCSNLHCPASACIVLCLELGACLCAPSAGMPSVRCLLLHFQYQHPPRCCRRLLWPQLSVQL